MVYNKIKGAIYGIQIGDALGACVEGFSKSLIHLRYGEVKNYQSGILGIPYFLKGKGSGTDDTRLSFAILKGLLQDDPIQGLTNEFNRERYNPLHIGKALFYAFLFHTGDWQKTAKKVDRKLKGKTAGNGSLMRTLPVALLFTQWNDVEKYTITQAEMTHLHPTSTESCLVYNRVGFMLLQGLPMREAIVKATKATPYENVFENKPPFSPDGYSFHTLSWALYWLYQTDSFEEAVIRAVNEGGDADTIASLVGGLAGIHYGYSSIPAHLLQVRNKEYLDELSTEATSFRLNK